MVSNCTDSELDRLTGGLLALIAEAVFVAGHSYASFARSGLLCVNTEILVFEPLGRYVVGVVDGDGALDFGAGSGLHHGCWREAVAV